MISTDRIESLRSDPRGLERLHRESLEAGDVEAFTEAIRASADKHPEDPLLSAWTYRLDLRSPYPVSDSGTAGDETRQLPRWWIAVAVSVAMGGLFTLIAGGKPPFPIPGEAASWFWIGWGPLTAVGILFYLGLNQRSRAAAFGAAAAVVLLLAAFAGLVTGSRTDDVAFLTALHLPFCAWSTVGIAVCLGHPDPARQGYAYLVKSAETLLTGLIYLAAGAVFLALTFGIFAVLGVELPEQGVMTAAAWIIGAVPVLALASVYDASTSPASQDWTPGLARTLRLLTRLLLPLALAVLLVYVLWFIPSYFMRAFEEREVLFVYNATILAILVLLTLVVSGPAGRRPERQDRVLRYGVLLLGGLTLLLNVYALAAILGRTLDGGLTPNRFAVLGWNGTTLLMMVVVGIQIWRRRADAWLEVFRPWTSRAVLLAAGWSLWVLIVFPFWFE
ncbi:MAG TPA: hypothetical protein VMP03_11045 [Methylomirabilota bacterium]|nr:hypothetical protein [Methylomirabilota bacterium]